MKGRPHLRTALFSVATLIGVVITVGERYIFAISLHRPVDLSEYGNLVTSSILTSVPFIYLALHKNRRIVLWALAFIATLTVNGWWLSKGIAYQRAPDGSGVDMFGGLILVLSPFAILGAVHLLDQTLLKFERRR